MNQSATHLAVEKAIRSGDYSLACDLLESQLEQESNTVTGGDDRSPELETRQLLAELYLRQGRISAAKRLILGLLERTPDLLFARVLEAHIARLEGHPEHAAGLLTQLGTKTGVSQDLLKFIAAEFVAVGAFGQAINTLQRVEPMDAQSFYHLGLSHFRLGHIGKALPIYRRLFASIHDNPTIARELSLVAAKFREYQTAIEAFSRYMQLVTPRAIDFLQFADLQLMGHNVPESKALLEKALTLGEDSADSRLLEGRIARLEGNYPLALERAHAAIELKPETGTAWVIISELTESTSVNEELTTRLAKAISTEKFAPEDLEQAQFALAELHAKSGDLSSAYMQMQAANETKSALLESSNTNYDRRSVEKHLQIVRSAFNKGRAPKASTNQDSPVFIVGMPRSGTTIIHRLLEASGELHCLGESEAMPFVYTQLQQRLGEVPEKQIHRLNENDLDQLATEYLQRAGAGDRDLVDKMPHNFLYVGMLLLMFPKARVIQMRRDAFDVCMSIYGKPFPEGHSYACHPENLAHFYHHSNALMNFWSEIFPEQIYDLDFDQFLNCPSDAARELFAFLGCRWQDSYLDKTSSSRHAFTFSELQIRKPISKHEARKWRRYRHVATDLIDALASHTNLPMTAPDSDSGDH